MVFKLRRGFFLSFSLSDTPHYENVPFEVPDSWVWCRLDDLCNIKGGKRIPKGKSFATQRTEHIYLRVTNMKNRTILFDDLKYIDDAVFQEIRNYTISSDDLYLTIAGTIGDVGEIPQEVSGMNLTENAAKLTDIGCNRLYLMYSLLSTNSQEHFSSKFHQVAQPKLSIETASSTLLPLPPLAEQQRIVTEIERWFTLIDQIEQDKSDLQTVIKQAKSKILDLAIHGKLVPQNPNDEPASELLKRIYPEAEITCDNGHYTNLPKGWAICKLSDLCRIENGFAFSSNDYKSQGIPLVRISNITHNTIDITDCVYVEGITDNKFKISKGDLLIAMSGATTGKMGVYLFDEIAYLNQRVGNIKILNKSSLFPDYRNIYMQSKVDEILKIAYGGAQPNISASVIGNFDFPLPPYKEQIRIVETVQRIFDQLDTITESL